MFASRPSILRQYASKTKKTDIPQPQKPMPCCSKKDAVTRRRRFGQQGNENDSKIDVEEMCSSPIKNDEDCCYIEVFKKPSSHGTNQTWSCATWSSGDDSSSLASSSSSVYELVSCSSSAYEVASDDEEATLPEEGPIIFGFRLCEYLDDGEEERSVSLADDGDDSRNGEALGKKKKKKKSRRCCRIPRRASDTSFDSITLADCPRVARKQL